MSDHIRICWPFFRKYEYCNSNKNPFHFNALQFNAFWNYFSLLRYTPEHHNADVAARRLLHTIAKVGVTSFHSRNYRDRTYIICAYAYVACASQSFVRFHFVLPFSEAPMAKHEWAVARKVRHQNAFRHIRFMYKLHKIKTCAILRATMGPLSWWRQYDC